MTKIMLYGGCHAQVMRDFLVSAYDASEIETDLVVNFELIAAGAPFPFARLDACDVLVYSPVENKGAYNTSILEDYCEKAGKPAICFPWLEWHGYCPGAVKGAFKSRYQWFYPDLPAIAEEFDDFAAFFTHVVTHYPSDDVIDRVFLLSTERLVASEQRHKMAVRVTDCIEENYRASRLFLISDHPSRVVYVHILRQILAILGLPFREDALVGEPQGQCKTPIFPRVAERLGLAFDDRDWADDLLLPGRLSSLETYLRLYFHGDGVVLAPTLRAELVAHKGAASIALPLGCDARVLAAPLDRNGRTGEQDFRFLATLAGPAIALEPQTRFTIDPKTLEADMGQLTNALRFEQDSEPSLYERPWHVEDLPGCFFYHTIDLPEHGVQQGGWDLRGRFADYVGGVDMRDKRVLDIGTASGFLSFEAEAAGAREVVSFDLDDARRQDLLPFAESEYVRNYDQWRRTQTESFKSWKRAYWLAHRLLGSRCKVFYGDIYDLPAPLGDFDVVILGAVLEHLIDPLSAIRAVSRRAAKTIVINTDYFDNPTPLALFNGRADRPAASYIFWTYSISLYHEYMRILGFEPVAQYKASFLGTPPAAGAARPQCERIALVYERRA